MKIGIIVEGTAERQALEEIVAKINISGVSIINPLFASIEPKETPKQIAKAAESRIKILQSKQVDKIIMLIDLENLDTCPGDRASEIKNVFCNMAYNVDVIVKNKCFENWLIADIDALEQLKNFKGAKNLKNKVNNKSDSLSALAELKNIKKINVKESYHKANDGFAISQKLDPLRIAKNSRSFRRFLRVLEHPAYIDQSIKP